MSRVRKSLIAVALLLTTAPALGGAGGEPPPDVRDLVRRLQQRYDTTSDFAADFTQEVEVPTLERSLESHGRVFYKRPGRMRWEFVEPEPQTIVADGETLWIWQPEQNQVIRAPFRAAFRTNTPVSFLFGVGRLDEDFEPSLVASDSDTVRLRLDPKRDEDLGTLFVILERDTAELRGAEIADPLGNVTRLRFRDLRREVGLKESKFRFEIPEGADVVESPGVVEE